MIGIYGGTFDPVHYGHLRTAFEVKEALVLDEVRLVPCHLPPHRELPAVDSAQRLQLLELAVAGIEGMVVDRCELQRPGPSYMVDTLLELREACGDKVPLVLILGSDAFLGLTGWSRWQQLFELAHIAIMKRPGHLLDLCDQLAAEMSGRTVASPKQLAFEPAGKIIEVDVTQLEISATRLRKLLKEGGDPRFLLPDSVREEIIGKNLYR